MFNVCVKDFSSGKMNFCSWMISQTMLLVPSEENYILWKVPHFICEIN